MQIAHHVPPKWSSAVGYRPLMITFVPWVEQGGPYVQWLKDRPSWAYLILNHSTFEKDLEPVSPLWILTAAKAVRAHEVVLPDVLGDPQETVRRSNEAYRVLTGYRKMFVPQARTMSDWLDCYEEFVQFVDKPVVFGLSSLRRKKGLRFQRGSRISMLQWVHAGMRTGHLLGLNSVSHFFKKELPLAEEGGAISLDTCQAFALAIRNLAFTKDGPRVFLGDLGRYENMTKEQLDLAMLNILLFKEACNDS